ncbi:MAG: high-potential iron-sulfur protein [Bdellovibrionales bacterium]|nr:high-potential iron-sulfur protein [Bdellovibrionales bacterium]
MGGKKAAPCSVMANKFVSADAWCLSWNKKA